MASLRLHGVKKVLCLGAHSDDIEIGCGATVLRLIQEQPGLELYWLVFSAVGARAREAKASAVDFLRDARARRIRTMTYRESYFPDEWSGIKDTFEQVKRSFAPDLVLTQYRNDRHQDHRVLSDLAWNTFRNHLVLEYEIPKYDGDLGSPNVYIPVSRALGERKIRALLRHFQSQTNRHWFTADTFWALMRLRGIECASATGFAEAFYGRKLSF
ncbi:MAG TPA: PIG-L deacetylase family protein [Candidatus Sulfopaludibacter sp.]|nr:PIG-L deacetylase family protein [Candidatus Sulfopaludibacter sp.]